MRVCLTREICVSLSAGAGAAGQHRDVGRNGRSHQSHSLALTCFFLWAAPWPILSCGRSFQKEAWAWRALTPAMSKWICSVGGPRRIQRHTKRPSLALKPYFRIWTTAFRNTSMTLIRASRSIQPVSGKLSDVAGDVRSIWDHRRD